MKQRDLYIEILNYGKMNLGTPVFYKKLLEYLTDKGLEFDEFAVRQFFYALFVNRTFPGGNDSSAEPPSDGEFFIEHGGYFNLLEFEELTSARKSSFWATIFAIIAITISIFSTIVSIYYSNVQVNSPTKLEKSQLERLDINKLVKPINELGDSQKFLLNEIQQIKKLMIEIQKHNKATTADAKSRAAD